MTARRRGLPRHLRRHRLAHHDGQRPRRARLGRRRHRGRGRDARPAGLHADPARRRLQAHRRSCPSRRHRHRPASSRSPRCCASTAWSASSSSSTARASAAVPLANRATIGNMSPEFGSTCGDLPDRRRDAATTWRLTGRSDRAGRPGRGVRRSSRASGTTRRPSRLYSGVPRARPLHGRALHRRPQAPAGPHRPRAAARRRFHAGPARLRRQHVDEGEPGRSLPGLPTPPPSTRERDAAAPTRHGPRAEAADPTARPPYELVTTARVVDRRHHLLHQHLEPVDVMIGRRAAWPRRRSSKGLTPQAVGQDHARARLQGRHRLLREGRPDRRTWTSSASTWSATAAPPASATPARCSDEVSKAVNEHDLAVVSVLSGNRNFEGRINPDVKMNYLASPPLVVAYALAGTMDIDISQDAARRRTRTATPVYLRDIWPTPRPRSTTSSPPPSARTCSRTYYSRRLRRRRALAGAADSRPGDTFDWDSDSTYVRKPPYFEGMAAWTRPRSTDITGARVLAKLGDSVTTDHISPAGAIKADTPAGRVPDRARRRAPATSTRYGSRRGNHEVMIRGTFANIRLRNQIAPGTEGGFTRDFTQDDGR